MIYIFTRVLLGAFSLLVAAYVVPGIVVDGLYAALTAALVLGVVHLVVRPILFVLTLPITIVTLGLFHFVLNAGLFWFVASFVEGFAVAGFLNALLGSIIVSVVTTIGSRFLA